MSESVHGLEGAGKVIATAGTEAVTTGTGIMLAGNELWRIGVVFGILLGSFIVGKIVAYLMARGAKRDEAAGEEITLAKLILKSASGPTVYLIFAGALKSALLFLTMSGPVRQASNTVVQLIVSVGIAYFLYRLVDILEYYLYKYTESTESKIDDMLVPLLRKTFRVVIVIIAGLYIAESVSGKPITTILAGFGIGGLAVALAAQDSIKNLFGSIMILIDRPFEVGQRIVVDGFDGVVEEIGFRSSRVRTLTGHLITVPNDKMISTNVENIGRRPYIRRLANITITYDTPPEKVERAVTIIKDILDNHEGMHPDFPPRVYFNEFNSDSLNILVIYWFHPPDYWSFCEFSEKVNLKIMRAFEEEGIEFAFPTQTLYLANDDRRQLAVRMMGNGLEPKL